MPRPPSAASGAAVRTFREHNVTRMRSTQIRQIHRTRLPLYEIHPMRRKPEYGRLGARWRGGSVEPVGAGSKRRGACRPKRSLARVVSGVQI
eukprot:COSAG06_NODE_53_length_27962_cov_135.359222_10_plen_92_part_00